MYQLMLRKHWCIYIAGYVIHKDVPVDVKETLYIYIAGYVIHKDVPVDGKETLMYIYCWLCYTQGCAS